MSDVAATSLVTSTTALAAPVDIERVRTTAGYYTNGRVSVVIFANGTCVFPPLQADAVTNSLSLIRESLAKPDFVVREMDDRNFVVGFGEKVFAIIFRDEFDRIAEQVADDVAQSNSTEVVLGVHGRPVEHFHMGVVARTRLLEDFERPVVATSIGTTRA